MKRYLFLLSALLIVAADAGGALAQTRTRGRRAPAADPQMGHRFEIIPFGGYVWTFSRRVTVDVPGEGLRTGDIDLKDSGTWGVEAAFNLRPGAQLTLMYQRQDTDIEFRAAGIGSPSAPWSVEYWHIGGIGGVPRGNMFPFSGLSLGGTRYIDDQSGEDVWKFSIILRLGAKFYVNERLGLMVQARLPWTVTNGGLGIGIGTGGAGVTFGGSGIAQIDVGGGIMINI